MIPLIGYADRLSVRPGETIEFKVSSQDPAPFAASLVRIVCADPNPAGPGIQEVPVAADFAGSYPSRAQAVAPGSYGRVAASGPLGSLDDLTLVENAIINVIEAYVIGVILSALTPLTMFQGVLIAAAVFSIYVSLGGIWGTAVTNVIHSIVILASLLAVGVLGVREMGGWDSVTVQVNARLASSPSHSQAAWWGFAGAGLLPVFGMLFSAVIHSPAASIYANYSTATRSERSLVPAFIVGGLIAALMPILAGAIGILAVARYGLNAGLAGYDNITTIASEISPVMGGCKPAGVAGYGIRFPSHGCGFEWL